MKLLRLPKMYFTIISILRSLWWQHMETTCAITSSLIQSLYAWQALGSCPKERRVTKEEITFPPMVQAGAPRWWKMPTELGFLDGTQITVTVSYTERKPNETWEFSNLNLLMPLSQNASYKIKRHQQIWESWRSWLWRRSLF